MNAGPKRGVVAAAAVCDADAPDLFSRRRRLPQAREAQARTCASSFGGAARAAGLGPNFRCAETATRSPSRSASRTRALRPPPRTARRCHRHPVRWHLISPQLAVVVWPAAAPERESRADVDAARAPDALRGRERRRRRPRRAAHLPSSNYEGHNLYAATLRAFERLAAAAGATARRARRSSRSSTIGGGAASPPSSSLSSSAPSATLRHELCHARFALDAEYRRWCEAAWAARVDALGKWLGALGDHATRRADAVWSVAPHRARAILARSPRRRRGALASRRAARRAPRRVD